MSATIVEHRGTVLRVEDGKAIVAMETTGCSSCSQSSGCGIGKLASGRPATLLTLPAIAGIEAGDQVGIALPENRLTLSALFGYLFPAFAMLFGAWLGATLDGSDGATAIGAIVGFLGALLTLHILASLLPGLMPVPKLDRLASDSGLSKPSQKELDHER